jgi:hypothetical protein
MESTETMLMSIRVYLILVGAQTRCVYRRNPSYTNKLLFSLVSSHFLTNQETFTFHAITFSHV